jgi:hypothetical protein
VTRLHILGRPTGVQVVACAMVSVVRVVAGEPAGVAEAAGLG